MKIIIEGYQYKEEDVRATLVGFEPFTKDGKIGIDYVGYFYSKEIADCIFFLPKVVLNEKNDVFGYAGIKPEHIIDIDVAMANGAITGEDHSFISQFSVWIYRAIREFYKLNNNSEILLHKTFSRIDNSTNKVEGTLLDIVLALIQFNRENHDFFMYIIKNVHSGYNKINWNKTISRRTPFLQGKSQIYVNPINKKKQINFDEELIVIFFSILNHINKKYGFKAPLNFNYELVTDNMFENYLSGFGKTRLRQIKYKYFSDKSLLLWNLCYTFFELADTISSSNQLSDYLLARNFNIIFEAIIDELISDKYVLKDLKEQKDGKIVDHIYPYQSLVNDNDIYYIGDSKYYKQGNNLGDESVYKQFTYAKNVIQYNLDLFFKDDKTKPKRYLQYRDDLTEGYNITPNFFISARVPEEPNSRNYNDAQLECRDVNRNKNLSYNFQNRLFDRDTLWLSHYDISFLYVIALYARSNDVSKQEFKQEVRKEFKDNISKLLNEQYDFYILEPREEYSLTRAMDINFKRLYGKVFRPLENETALILALDHDADNKQNERLLEEIKTFFYKTEYKLGDDLPTMLADMRQNRKAVADYAKKDDFYELIAAEESVGYGTIKRVLTDSVTARESMIDEENSKKIELPELTALEDEIVLVGFVKNEQLQVIKKNLLYYVRTSGRSGEIHPKEGFDSCKYLFLHQGKKVQQLYKLKQNSQGFYSGKKLKEKGFLVGGLEEMYLAYKLQSATPIEITDEDLSNVIIAGIGCHQADAYYTTIKELFQIK